MSELKVIGWTSYDSKCQNIIVDEENQNDVISAVINEIKEKGFVFAGDDHQNSLFNCVPVLNNGKCLRCSMRCFATLMSLSYYGNTDKYMEFYMNMLLDRETKYPDCIVNEEEFVFDDGYDKVLPIAINSDYELIKSSLDNNIDLITSDIALIEIYEYLKNRG